VTGDIEDAPALDALPSFPVAIRGDDVVVSVRQDAAAVACRRPMAMCRPAPSDARVFLLVGGGAAALTAAQTLREDGFTGRIIMATADAYLPYDRIQLDKVWGARAARRGAARRGES
jgi:hypothetical protein